MLVEVAAMSVYLALHRGNRARASRVRFHGDLASLVEAWDSHTRVSPLFGIAGYPSGDGGGQESSKDFDLLFVGPTHPATVLAKLPGVENCWLSIGLFNLVLQVQDGLKCLELLRAGNRCELWKVRGGLVRGQDVRLSVRRPTQPGWRDDISSLLHVRTNSDPELHDALEEYAVLTASTLARAEQAAPESVLKTLCSMNSVVTWHLKSFESTPDELQLFDQLAFVRSINAGLARFASQTFSGTSPIRETECHYWVHSLLGTGMANLALFQIYEFVRARLATERIPERVGGYRSYRTAGDAESVRASELDDKTTYEYDHLSARQLPDRLGAGQQIFPSVTYLSGREGFHGTTTTLCAPLSVISGCSSSRWTLMTLTHEISHMVVDGVLGELLPAHDSSPDVWVFDDGPGGSVAAIDILRRGRGNQPSQLDALRYDVMFTMLEMDPNQEMTESGGQRSFRPSQTTLGQTLRGYRERVAEVMTHTFDFLYFYEADWKAYTTGVWVSWGVIPHVTNRVPDYLLRTLCAVAPAFAHEKDALESARVNVRKKLRALSKQGRGGEYVRSAMVLLKSPDSDLMHQVHLAFPLVKIVKGYLHSAKLARDLIAGGPGPRRTSRNSKQLLRASEVVVNPIAFVRGNTRRKKPLAEESLKILYALALNSRALV